MIDIEDVDIYIPNTENLRIHLKKLNYLVKPISKYDQSNPTQYKSLCFSDWVGCFERIQQANYMYYCMNKPTLTEDQSIFLLDIIHICPDYQTFKEALEQYINSNS